jgi:glycosyltransferase involved in cell wall biosynthesis
LKVAVVHSFYRGASPSGENIAVLQQTEALRRAGIEILEIYRHTDRLAKSKFYPLRSAVTAGTGHDFHDPTQDILAFDADLIHVHNLVPNFGTTWLKKIPIPVVTTLHNFRVSCSNGLLFRDGKVCVECPAISSFRAIQHACYQGSNLKTMPIALATRKGASGNPIVTASKALITQSPRVSNFLIEQGINPEKIHEIPGFVEDVHRQSTPAPRDEKYVFVGRPSPEKGLTELLEVWPEDMHLDVIGASAIDLAGHKVEENIHFLGFQDRTELRRNLTNYTALIFPGLVWEGAYPLVVREAFEASTPVVALAGSSASDLVTKSQGGKVLQRLDRESLKDTLGNVFQQQDDLRLVARKYYEDSFQEQVWVSSIQRTYRSLLGD